MSVKLLTAHHLEFLNLKGGCTGSSESSRVKMSCCWKPYVTTHLSQHEILRITNRRVPEAFYRVCTLEGVWGYSPYMGSGVKSCGGKLF